MSALASRTLSGPADYVGRQIDALDRAGLIVVMRPPRPHMDGVAVLVVLRKPAELASNARQLPAPTPARRLTPTQRRTAIRGALVAGGLAALAVAVWLVVRALSSAASWVGGNPALVFLGALVLAMAGLLRFGGRRGRTVGGGSGCSGLIQHCNGCPDHRRVSR